MNINMRGDKELVALFDTFGREVQSEVLRPLVNEAAVDMVAGMKKRVPYVSGDLFRGIASQPSPTSGVPKAWVKIAGPGRYYWHLVEYGTKAHTLNRERQGWTAGRSGKKGTLFEGHFTKRVHASAGASSSFRGHHPGTRAKPFLRPTMRRLQRLLPPQMRAAVEQYLAKQARTRGGLR